MPEPPVPEGDHRYDVLNGRGTDLGRLLALSDGVFAFAMTLLVVNLVLPTVGASGGGSLLGYLGHLLPSLAGYALSFFIIGSWWSQHHALFSVLRRYDATLVRINSLFLLTISVTPFMLALVFEFGTGQLLDAGLSAKVAVALYSAIQLASGLCYLGMWRYATGGRRLVDPDLPDEWVRYLERIGLGRIVIMSAAIAVAFVIPPLSEVLWVGVIFNRHRVAPPNRARAP